MALVIQANEAAWSVENPSLSRSTNLEEDPSPDTLLMFKGASSIGSFGSQPAKKELKTTPGECPDCKQTKFLFKTTEVDKMTKRKKVTFECWSVQCQPLEYPLSQERKDWLKSMGWGEEYAAYFYKPNAGLSEYGIRQHVHRDIEYPDWRESKFL